jgi:hypothetical protein
MIKKTASITADFFSAWRRQARVWCRFGPGTKGKAGTPSITEAFTSWDWSIQRRSGKRTRTRPDEGSGRAIARCARHQRRFVYSAKAQPRGG